MGVCSGIVTHKDGSPARDVRVTGSVSSGGMTDPVRTDRDGKFVLEWRGCSGLSKLFADGKLCERDVRNGTKVHLRI